MQDSLPPLIRMQVHDKSKINPLLGNNLTITQRNFQESTNNINSDHQNNKNILNTIPPFVSYFLNEAKVAVKSKWIVLWFDLKLFRIKILQFNGSHKIAAQSM